MATTKKMTTFIFGFTCHQNIFAVTNELKEPTQARVDRVICSAVGTALAVYLLFAGSAYLTFGGLVESDILNNYPGNRVVTAARFCFSVLVALSFPLQVHPSRKCILSLIGFTHAPAQIVLEALDGTAYDLVSSGLVEQCEGKRCR